MNIPANLKYTKDHEWLLIEGNIGTIGITDFAQGELGDIVYLDVDKNLQTIAAGETFGTIEAVKTVSDLYAPVDGKVLEINEGLNDEPQVINTDPYGKGWIVKVEITNASQINQLMSGKNIKIRLDNSKYRKK